MTVLTAAELATQQANVESILSLSNVVRNKANTGAKEFCNIGNLEQAAIQRGIASKASLAVAAAQAMIQLAYGISIPVSGGDNITPTFGSK